MYVFFYLFAYRTLSGVQNGLGYAKRNGWLAIVSCLLIAGAMLPAWIMWPQATALAKTGAALGTIISMVGAFGVYDSFSDSFKVLPKDVHFWELLATSGVMMCWIALGGDLIQIAAHVYPALLLHKGAVNIGSRLPFWGNRTDDPTGATYNIPLLGIRIPRFGVTQRKLFAVVSFLLMMVAYVLEVRININTVLAWAQ